MSGPKKLNAATLYYIFNSANIHRWNDHFRVVDFTELDKQAHKAAIAWVLGKCAEDAGKVVEWDVLIKHFLFSFLHRIAITDLKPPLYYRIIEDETRKKALDSYALGEFQKVCGEVDPEFMEEFRRYLDSPQDSCEDRILDAAHYLATRYEFDMIYPFNTGSVGIDQTKNSIERRVDDFMDLDGMDKLKDRGSNLYAFVSIIGQLRCQQRWVRTPREPKTTVLGHSVFVATAIYLHDLDEGITGAQLYDDYYRGLFHDLPEVFTKDVITPVKNSDEALPKFIETIEKEMFTEKILPLLPASWHDELYRNALSPFGEGEDINAVKACDILAAWIEAFVSTRIGITSLTLVNAIEMIKDKLAKDDKGIGALGIIADFEKMKF